MVLLLYCLQINIRTSPFVNRHIKIGIKKVKRRIFKFVFDHIIIMYVIDFDKNNGKKYYINKLLEISIFVSILLLQLSKNVVSSCN